MALFKSDYQQKIDGFWDPESGPMKGVYVDYARVEYPFHVIEIVEDQPEAALRVQDDRGDTSVEPVYGLTAGMRVGVSNYAALKGLEKYKNYHCEFVLKGTEELRGNRIKKLIEVELSDRPVRSDNSRGGRGGRAVVPHTPRSSPNGATSEAAATLPVDKSTAAKA